MNIKINSVLDPCKGKTLVYVVPIPKSLVLSTELVPSWCPPSAVKVKFNSDGSFIVDGRVGAGMFLRDSNGAIIFSACRTLYSCHLRSRTVRLYGGFIFYPYENEATY